MGGKTEGTVRTPGQATADDALFEALGKSKKAKKRKIVRTVLIVVCVLAVVLVAGVGILQRQVRKQFASSFEEVLSAQAERGTISTVVSGSGMLTNVDTETVCVPSGVEVTDILVEFGDPVQEGDLLATVDMASVRTAMSELQDEIEKLDDQITDADGDTVSSYISAGVPGRVKVIYVGKGTLVEDAMVEYGGLAEISLDGYMAVDIETGAVEEGDEVIVVLSDGEEMEGTVGKVVGTTATILVSDNGPAYNETVTVRTESGTELGTGSAYIHSPLKVTGYAGTISAVYASLNQQVYSSTTLFTLTDTSSRASYDALLRSRSEKKETLLELLKIQRNSGLTAPISGSVYSVADLDNEDEETEITDIVVLSPDVSMSVTIIIHTFNAHIHTGSYAGQHSFQLIQRNHRCIGAAGIRLVDFGHHSGEDFIADRADGDICLLIQLQRQNIGLIYAIIILQNADDGKLYAVQGYGLTDAVHIADELFGRSFVDDAGVGVYSGTISSISVREGDTVYVGQTLMSLENPGNSAEYQRLIDQRHEYEELMRELFTMYRAEAITAPCDGIVTGVDKNGAYLLTDSGGSWAVRVLSFFSGKADDGFVAYAAKVVSVSDNAMELLMSPTEIPVTDLTALSGISANVSGATQTWNYSGDPTVYVQDEDGLLRAAGIPKVGDILLAVGDSEMVHWFVAAEGSIGSDLMTHSDNAAGSLTAQLLSEISEPSDHSADTSGTGEDPEAGLMPASDPQNEDPPAEDPPVVDPPTVTVSVLEGGAAGQSSRFLLSAYLDSTPVNVTWNAVDGLPEGLAFDSDTGILSGIPMAAGSYPLSVCLTYDQTYTACVTLTVSAAASQADYRGYVAQVTDISGGIIQVRQTEYSYSISDLTSLPTVSADTSAMSVEKTYPGDKAVSELAVGDIVLVVFDKEGTLIQISRAMTAPTEGDVPGMGTGGMPSGGMAGGMAGGSMGQTQAYSLYSLEKLTIASVTSQEHMTLDVTVDEMDITKIHVGQAATITMDALAGESFPATVTQISNSGTNEGGSSKFTVELTLEKSGEMLPGMSASAFIGLGTAENVLCVPVSALGEGNGKTVLYTSYDPEKKSLGDPVTVTIGVADCDYVQILEGLSEGETVYYSYYDTLPGSSMPSAGAAPFK